MDPNNEKIYYQVDTTDSNETTRLINSSTNPIIATPVNPSQRNVSALAPIEYNVTDATEVINVKNKQKPSLALKSTEELSALRANINLVADRLESLLANEQAAATTARLLNKTTFRLRQAKNAHDILVIAVNDARESLQADRVVVYTFDENWSGTIRAEAVIRGWRTSLGDQFTDPCFSRQYAQLYQKGRISVIENIYEAGLTECYLQQLEPYGVQASLIVPILLDQKLYGLLIAHQCSGTRAWNESETEFLSQLAIQIGYSLEQAIFLETREIAARQTKLLTEISSKIRETLNTENIFNVAVLETRAILKADRVVIYRFDANWQGSIVAESVVRTWKSALGDTIADPCFAQRYVQPYQQGRISATENIYEAGLTECHLKQLEPYGIKANLVVPILVNRELYGLLIAHQCESTRKWQKSEIDLFQQVASQLGFALDQALLLEEQKNVAKQAQLLNRITSWLRESVDQSSIFDKVVEESRQALQADRVIIYSFDAKWQGTVVSESVVKGYRAGFGDTIADPCFQQNYVRSYERGRISATENIYEAGLTECHLKQLEPYGIKANLVVPILTNQKLYGLLIAHQCSRTRQWKESEIDFFKQLAAQIGLALDQIKLIENQKTIATQAQKLSKIISNIRQYLTPEDIMSSAVEDTQSALKTDRVITYVFDHNWQGTVVAESVVFGFSELLGKVVDDPCCGQQYLRVYQKGKVRSLDNIYEANLDPSHISQLESFAVKSHLIAPILVNQKLYGLLVTHQCSNFRQWQDSEIDFFKQVAMQVGFAIDQAFLVTEQQEATERAQLLNEITARIRETLDVDRIFQVTVQECRKALKADRSVIYQFDQNFEGKIAAESVIGDWRHIINIEQDIPCFPLDYVQEYKQGRFSAYNNVVEAGLTPCHLEKLQEWQVKANIVVPIVVREKLYGLLGVHQCSRTRVWQKAEIDFLKLLGIQVAYAFDQARLLEQIQKSREDAEQISQTQRQQKEALQSQIRTFMKDIEGSFEGDLTVRARVTEGEMGTVADFFNATIENLQDLVLQVKSSVMEVSGTVNNSENQVNDVAKDAQRQVSSIKQALLKLQTMAKSIQSVANNAKQAQLQVEKGNETIQAGEHAMEEMVSSIKSVQQTVEKTAKKVKRLGEASQNISRIVSLIGDLAKQTNILALNASIEAKHTGSDGQDFGVIASEVRNLAEQSAEATKEIEQLVAQIQTETTEAVTSMEDGQKQVNIGASLVEETRHQLTEITTVSSEISGIVKDMAKSAISEVRTAADLYKTMQEVAAIANQTSNQSLALTTSFKNLLDVADQLQESVTQFKVN